MVDCVLRPGFRTPCVTGLTLDCDAAGGMSPALRGFKFAVGSGLGRGLVVVRGNVVLRDVRTGGRVVGVGFRVIGGTNVFFGSGFLVVAELLGAVRGVVLRGIVVVVLG